MAAHLVAMQPRDQPVGDEGSTACFVAASDRSHPGAPRTSTPDGQGENMAYSDEVLEQTPERATRLLTGIGAVATIRTLLAGAGMNDHDILEGRTLLVQCLAAPAGVNVGIDTKDAKAQRDAVAEIDLWDEPNFARFEATLRRHYPDACDYVFRGLSASIGVTAVTGVATFFGRIDALDEGSDPHRTDKKEADKEAVELLAKRGLDQEERARMKKLVDIALGPTGPLPDAPAAPTPEQRRAALTALRDWYNEWAAAARSVVKKKAYRIRLGLANRKSPTKAGKKPEGETQPQ
jgi:hypothetical protein